MKEQLVVAQSAVRKLWFKGKTVPTTTLFVMTTLRRTGTRIGGRLTGKSVRQMARHREFSH
jgi:hypothetical protein